MRRRPDTELVALPVTHPPASVARVARRAAILRMCYSPLLGTDGSGNLMTHLGETQVARPSKDARYDSSMTPSDARLPGRALLLCARPLRARRPVRPRQPVRRARPRGHRRDRRTRTSPARQHIEVSISVLPTVFAAAVFGPLAAMVVAAASSLLATFPIRASLRDGPRKRQGGPASQVGRLHMHPRHLRSGRRIRRCGGAAARCQRSDTQLVIATVDSSARGRTARSGVRGASRCKLRRRPMRSTTSACARRCTRSRCASTRRSSRHSPSRTREVSPWTLPLFFLPALAAQRLFGLYQEQRQLATNSSKRTPISRRRTSHSRPRSSRPSTPETATPPVIRRRSRSTPATSPSGWDSRTRRSARRTRRSRPRHRQDRTSGRPAREARSAHARRATRDAEALGDRRANPGEGGELRGDRLDRAPPSRARRRRRLPGRARRRRDSAPLANHCRRGRLQRDDVGSAVPRRDAEPGGPASARAGSRLPVRHIDRGRIRSRARDGDRALPNGDDRQSSRSSGSKRKPTSREAEARPRVLALCVLDLRVAGDRLGSAPSAELVDRCGPGGSSQSRL